VRIRGRPWRPWRCRIWWVGGQDIEVPGVALDAGGQMDAGEHPPSPAFAGAHVVALPKNHAFVQENGLRVLTPDR
jgi:hypothetical protein